MAGFDPVDPNELLYRRVSLKANPPWTNAMGEVLQRAFIPDRKRDDDGISLFRAAYRGAAEVAAPGASAHRDYVVAVVRAGDLIKLGLTLDVTPDEVDLLRGGTPAHVSVREMNAANYRSDDVLDWARQIAERCVLQILRPFHGPETSQP